MRVQRYLAGLASAAPGPAVALTWKVWRPTATVRLNGERQGLKGRLSSLHSKLAPGWSALNVNRASLLEVRFGGCLPSLVAGASFGLGTAFGWPLSPALPASPPPPPPGGGATRLTVAALRCRRGSNRLRTPRSADAARAGWRTTTRNRRSSTPSR